MKTTIKNLINQVKKALTTKSSLPENISNSAYADNHGNLISRDMPDSNTDIIVFIGGIVEDMTKCEKLYNKDALTLAADTGIFNGGTELPENFTEWYTVPDGDFNFVVKVPADDLKAAAYTVSKDNTRPILTFIHLAPAGMIEACDGFRAYRKKCDSLQFEALTDLEKNNGIYIPGRATAYSLKGDVTIYTSDKFLKLVDECGITLFVRKPNQGNFINLDTVYTRDAKYKTPAATVTIKDIKTFTSVLKTAINAAKRQRFGVSLRVFGGKIQYYIPVLDVFGSIEAEASNDTDTELYYTLNPKYLYDAIINQGGVNLDLPNSKQLPIFCNGDNSSALVLPIRTDGYNPFDNYKPETEAPATEAAAETVTPAETTPATEANQDAPTEAPAPDPETETAAPAEKLEIVPREEKPAAPVEVIPPEIVKAREIYKKLLACNFRPTKLQEGEADIIYNAYREKLQPIARKAGGLYIDTLSIIAAVMAIYEELEKEGA